MDNDVKIIFRGPVDSYVAGKEFVVNAVQVPQIGTKVALHDFWSGPVKDVIYVSSTFDGWQRVEIELGW